MTALGVNAGIAARTTASALGLGALLRRSDTLFTSFLPQFVSPDGPVLGQLLLLGAIFNVVGVVWLCSCAVFVSRVGDELRRPRVRAAFERLTGCVLIAFGVRLATERP